MTPKKSNEELFRSHFENLFRNFFGSADLLRSQGFYFTRRFLTVHLLFRTTRTITCESGVTLILFSPFVSIVLANNAP